MKRLRCWWSGHIARTKDIKPRTRHGIKFGVSVRCLRCNKKLIADYGLALDVKWVGGAS